MVYKGWKFPIVFLTETDEKYLFDVEVMITIIFMDRFFFSKVKLKLLHDTAYTDLFDILVDHPPCVLLQRTGLLQAVLDIVGSPSLSLSDLGYIYLISITIIF